MNGPEYDDDDDDIEQVTQNPPQDTNDRQAGNPSNTVEQGEENGEYETADSHFPPPPPHWTEFSQKDVDAGDADADEIDEGTFSKKQITQDPPDISYIFEQGYYEAFGDRWPLKEVPPSLTEVGIQQLYPDGLDRKEALQKLLHTLIFTYIQLIGILIKPPPAINDSMQEQGIPSEVEQAVMHLRTTSINIHHLLNSLRPIQAHETLKLLMKAQIDRRRRKIQELKKECQANVELVERVKAKHNHSFEWVHTITNRSPENTSEPSVEQEIEKDLNINDAIKRQALSEWQTLLDEVSTIE